MMKRILTALLALTMVLSSFVIVASAATPTDYWTSYYDTDWYEQANVEYDNVKDGNSGNNNYGIVYEISTAEELAAFAKIVDDGYVFQKQKVVLTTNIELKDHLWNPIGVGNNYFQGEFDGQGYTISGMTIYETGSITNVGFFSTVGCTWKQAPAYIHDFSLTNCNVTTKNSNYVSFVTGQVFTKQNVTLKIENVSAQGSIDASLSSNNLYVGGIVAQQNFTSTSNVSTLSLTNVIVDATITASGSATIDVGGLIGRVDMAALSGHTLTLTNCVNRGSISGGNYVGGLIGQTKPLVQGEEETPVLTMTMTNCLNQASVSGKTYAGGLIGWNNGNPWTVVQMNDCASLGMVSADTAAGAFVGLSNRLTQKYAIESFVNATKTTLIGANSSGNVNVSNYYVVDSELSEFDSATVKSTQINAYGKALEKASALTDYSKAATAIANVLRACETVAKDDGLCAIQMSADGSSIRFVGKVKDIEGLTNVGMYITINGTTQTMTTKEVFDSIVSNDEHGVADTCTAETLGAGYLYAAGVYGLPATGTVTITVQTFTETQSEGSEPVQTPSDSAYVITVTDGQFVSSVKQA